MSEVDEEKREPPAVPATVDGPNGFNEDEKDNSDKASSITSPSPIPPQLDSAKRNTSSIEAPIVYHYLTFATPLPSPTELSTSAPACPDLIKFTDPFEWSNGRKNVLIWLSCLATGSAAYGPGSYAAVVPQIRDEWHISEVVAYVGITIFTIGFAIAPMVLAPFSEINGRRPVFLVTGFLFLVFVILSAVTPTFAGMLVVRLLAGCASSTFSTMVGGVVADIYHAADRNAPMTYFTGSVMLATGLGPLISAYVAEHLHWRWVFWIHAIYVGALVFVMIFFFKETRGSVLLSRKAKALNQWYEAREQAGFYGFDIISEEHGQRQSQRIRWKVQSDENRLDLRTMIRTSLTRPFHLLFTEPVVFFFSLWISFSWAILYMMFNIIPYMYSTVYGFTVEESGATFSAISIAGVLATILSISQERIALRYGKLAKTPEGRLFFCCFESALLPIGLFWFGWSSRSDIPWIVPTLAVGCATFGIFSIYLAVFNYLADCYGYFASSAIAAQSFCRNLMGGAMPLYTIQMFKALGFWCCWEFTWWGWGFADNSSLGAGILWERDQGTFKIRVRNHDVRQCMRPEDVVERTFSLFRILTIVVTRTT